MKLFFKIASSAPLEPCLHFPHTLLLEVFVLMNLLDELVRLELLVVFHSEFYNSQK